jgi:hypothetical protein
MKCLMNHYKSTFTLFICNQHAFSQQVAQNSIRFVSKSEADIFIWALKPSLTISFYH